MGTSGDVKEKLPGIQFRVASSSAKAVRFQGKFTGRIELYCEFREPRMFDAAVEKLNGFKVFSELSEEITDALGAELDNTVQILTEVQQEVADLKQALEARDAEIARLRGLLQTIEDDLCDEVHCEQ